MWSSATIADSPAAPSVPRQLAESLVLLALAVILFRAFAAEGYLISTGSMAPCLLGYHKRVVCPSCHCLFARGDSSPAESGTDYAYAQGEAEGSFLGWADQPARQFTTCPNCGRNDIDLSAIPRNEGDQLLVHKHAYEFRDPRRWEVIVFQSSEEAHPAYCKRVVGLPGETIAVRDGDIHVDGVLQRKPYPVQKSLRIPVWDNEFQPDEQGIPPRWSPLERESGWSITGTGFTFQPVANSSQNSAALEYHHWIRLGGAHVTAVKLPSWPQGVAVPQGPQEVLRYTAEQGRLLVQGVLTELEFRRWKALSDEPTWHAALDELAAKSHFGPIADDYGYNADGTRQSIPVHDLSLELQLTPIDRQGRFEVLLTDGGDEFTLVLDFADEKLELLANGDVVPVRTVPFPAAMRERQFLVEVSTFDRQVLVAIAGDVVFEPLLYGERSQLRKPLRRPARLVAAGGTFEVQQLKLYRDVYYTPKGAPAGHEPACVLAADEFYVLGDNSPVSVDSRVWEHPAVRRKALIGKPLLVHLPSRQGEIEVAGKTQYLRIPDFSRVRYIR